MEFIEAFESPEAFEIESPEVSHSFAKPDFARVTHTHLELDVDFDRKVLKGYALLNVQKHKLSVQEVILDNYQLVISSVTDDFTRESLKYHVSNHEDLGSSLTIQLPSSSFNVFKILIKYETSPTSPALHWLTPEQTADGTHPFLLSDNKLTYARAVFPCQDTPSVKFTFSAKISARKDLIVLMPAALINKKRTSTHVVHKFQQQIPIASYSLVIVVGLLLKIVFPKNPRIIVWVEKTFLEESLKTFANSDRIDILLRIAETLCGSYVWGTYNICVLPPSISHFEIECPSFTFVSPTLLGGDIWICSVSRSLSQNWAGHLVTCANYKHLWLNNSFSLFISRKIMGKVFSNKVMKFYNRKTYKEMLDKIQNNNILSERILLPNLLNKLPYDSIQCVPYERGCKLLWDLEIKLGGATVFERFLKFYFETLKKKSIITNDFLNLLVKYFDKPEIINNFEWEDYFYAKYLLRDIPRMVYILWERTSPFVLAEYWINCINTTNFTSLDIELSSDEEKITFLNCLHASHTILPIWEMRDILSIYKFDNQNAEIRFVWLRLCIKSRWQEKIWTALDFATKFCSPKFACPIFQDFYNWTEMREIAIVWYIQHKKKMLHETQEKLKLILHLDVPREILI